MKKEVTTRRSQTRRQAGSNKTEKMEIDFGAFNDVDQVKDGMKCKLQHRYYSTNILNQHDLPELL